MLRLVMLLILVVGCDPPRRLVIEDHDRTYDAIHALDSLQERAECRYYERSLVSGEIDGGLPPFETVHLLFVGRGDRRLKGSAGRAYWGALGGRCRIFVGPTCSGPCIAHELLHCLGEGHDGEPGDLMSDERPGWNNIPTGACLN